MSISSVGSTASAIQYVAPGAADGDTPAQEAAESTATKRAEQQNGGFAPKASPSTRPGGLDKIV
jgi:hypothetical protein